MPLVEADITEFRELWREEFNEAISQDEARFRATQLVALYLALYQSTGDPSQPPRKPHSSP